MQAKTITFYAQRHGDRRGDYLTQVGKDQVLRAKHMFDHVQFDAVYASPKLRAVQTATIFAGGESAVTVSNGLYPPLADSQVDRLWGDPDTQGTTIHDWFINLKRGWGPRAQALLLAAMHEMVLDVVQDKPNKNDICIYFASHSLYLEMLLPEQFQNECPLAVAELCIVRCVYTDSLSIKDVRFVRRA